MHQRTFVKNIKATEARAWSSSTQVCRGSLGRQSGLSRSLTGCLWLLYPWCLRTFLKPIDISSWTVSDVWSHWQQRREPERLRSKHLQKASELWKLCITLCDADPAVSFHLESQVLRPGGSYFYTTPIFPSGSPVRRRDNANDSPCSPMTWKKPQKNRYFRTTTTHRWLAVS